MDPYQLGKDIQHLSEAIRRMVARGEHSSGGPACPAGGSQGVTPDCRADAGKRDYAGLVNAKPLGSHELSRLASAAAGATLAPPALELSARVPFAANGTITDCFSPVWWSVELNGIALAEGRPSPSTWPASSLGVAFTAPAAGKYFVVGTFAGWGVTMHLYGPWGEATADSPTLADWRTVGAVIDLAEGASLNFTFQSTGGNDGYVRTIQVYQLA